MQQERPLDSPLGTSIKTSPRQSRRSSAQALDPREAESNNSQPSAGGAATPTRLSTSNRSDLLGPDTFNIELLPDGPSSEAAQAFGPPFSV